MKTILFVAGESERYYFEPFVDACSEEKVRLLLLDPLRFPEEASFSARQGDDGNVEGEIDLIHLNGPYVGKQAEISLATIDVAWYLREGIKDQNRPTDLESRFTYNETRQALRALFSVMSCRWVNERETVERVTSNKLLQQTKAIRCGLQVPRTIVSNQPNRVVGFSDPQEGLLLKSLGYIKLDEEGRLALYSERFSHEELSENPSAIQACPVFAQEYVQKHCEHRVMVIGSQILACRIDSQASEKTRVDWRHYDFEHVEHRAITLPREVQEKLLSFMTSIDLRYGAIDMVETPEGDFVFLEVNPSGQWGWLTDIAKLPVPQAVASMLETI